MHTNKINGKKYVGITSQLPEKRWLGGYGYERRLRFGRAIRKYGWDSFEHVILHKDLSEAEAKKIEQNLIRDLHLQDSRFGYNITGGGDGVCGFHHSKISKAKMSAMKSGSKHPNYNCHLSESTRLKISSRLTGNHNAAGATRSAEVRERMSIAKKKPVIMYSDNTEDVRFISALDAQKETGISRKNISLCCLGQRKTAGGYHWKFA